jgi:predicted  nucleic acid-binding Zn-ribbon protein
LSDFSFDDCSAINAQWQGTGIDNVNLTADGCDGCNVVLGSNNTALVIENAFWIWAEDCSFFFYPLYARGPPSYGRREKQIRG